MEWISVDRTLVERTPGLMQTYKKNKKRKGSCVQATNVHNVHPCCLTPLAFSCDISSRLPS